MDTVISVLGPTLFNVATTTLKPLSKINKYFKYADDGYLIVPANNGSTIQEEIRHHAEWAEARNLKLNVSKTQEIVIFKNRKVAEPAKILDVNRVETIKILGVILDNYLTFGNHISETIKSCSQSFFALKTMKQHGLPNKALQNIFCTKILPKLL